MKCTQGQFSIAARMFKIVLTVIFLSFSNEFVSGEFRFANSYGSNMVLQRAPLSAFLWGFGEEGEVVRVSVNNIWTYYETVVDRGIFKFLNLNLQKKLS